MSIDYARLKAPLPPDAIEWRVGRAGSGDAGVWAKVLAYMTSRAVQDRLDDVVGPENWRVEYRMVGDALSCGIGVRVGDEWVWKWDGAGHLSASDGLSESDATKGDFSNAMKRAAVQWGIGRYLYRLPEGWANVHDNGAHYGRLKDGTRFHWDPPELPEWAVPEGYEAPATGGPATASPPPTRQQSAPPPPPSGGGFSLDQSVGFGKYKASTWRFLLANDPDYVQWAVDNMERMRPDTREGLKAALANTEGAAMAGGHDEPWPEHP